ncbi:Guanylate-binding protein 7 [Linum grandiflorum]
MSKNCSNSEGKLLPLVYCDESGKLKTDPDALRALREIQGPAAAVSVCGPSHPTTHNSIFNELVGRNSGHNVALKDSSLRGGLWMWSVPLKRTAVDGSQYNVIFLDGEGLDACDQTVAYNMQIFSLAVHLSSTVVYNLMGGIDESSSDARSFAAETSKHIRNKVYGAQDTISELGQFSPSFVWLLKDLHSGTTRASQKIATTDHQGHSRGSVSVVKEDVAPANDICESFRGIFSNKECFALVRLLKDENGLQYLGCAMLEQFQSEHQSQLAALTKFAYEKAMPKQVGGTVITGSILASIIECYVDALNIGATSTLSSLWQDVAESECRKAFQAAMRVYNSVFDQVKRLEEVPVEQAHSRALQSSVATYHGGAVGPGLARRKYEMLLQDFFNNSYKEAQNNAGLHFSSATDKMKNGLEVACQVPAAKFDDIKKVLDGVLLEYEALERSARSDKPSFTRSMLGPLFEHLKKVIETVLSEKDVLVSKCCTMEEKAALLRKTLEASEKFKSEYQSRYEDAVRDMNNLSHHYKNRMTEMENNFHSLEGKCSSLHEMLDSAKQESLDWKFKYEELFTKRIDGDDLNDTKTVSKSSDQWKDKYDLAVNEAKVAAENAKKEVNSLTDEAKLRETEFSNSLAKKDEEVKIWMVKFEDAEQRLKTLILQVQAAEEKIHAYDREISDSKLQCKELNDKYEILKASEQKYLAESRRLEEIQMRLEEKTELEPKYLSELERLKEIEAKCRLAEEEVNAAQIKLQEKTEHEQKYIAELETLRRCNDEQPRRAELEETVKDRDEEIGRWKTKCRLAEEEVNAAQIKLQEKTEYEQKYIAELETLRRCNAEQPRRAELEEMVKDRDEEIGQWKTKCRLAEEEVNAAQIKLQEKTEYEQKYIAELETLRRCNDEQPRRAELEEMVKDRDEEIGRWKTKCEGLENMLGSAAGVVNHLPFEAGSLEARLQSIQQHLYSEEDAAEVDETVLSTPSKRAWLEVATPVESLASDGSGQRKRRKGSDMMMSSLQKCTSIEVGSESSMRGEEDDAESQKRSSSSSSVSYARLTVVRMKQELNQGGYGGELLKLKGAKKKDIYALYRKYILKY